MTFNLDWICI